MGSLILFSYFFGERLEHGAWSLGQSADGMTMAFLTTNLVEMFRAFTTRSLTGSIFTMKTRNNWLWLALLWTFVLTCGVIFVPFTRALFGFTQISALEFGIAFALALSIIPIFEALKFFQRRSSRAH